MELANWTFTELVYNFWECLRIDYRGTFFVMVIERIDPKTRFSMHDTNTRILESSQVKKLKACNQKNELFYFCFFRHWPLEMLKTKSSALSNLVFCSWVESNFLEVNFLYKIYRYFRVLFFSFEKWTKQLW